MVRGLRAVSDFEAEGQLAHNNRVLADDIDTVFFMTAVEFGYISSSLVKEIATFGGDVSSMIPPAAVTALRTLVRATESTLGCRGRRARAIIRPPWTSCSCSSGSSRRSRPAPACPRRARSSSTRTPSST